jgi:hypothetical protein
MKRHWSFVEVLQSTAFSLTNAGHEGYTEGRKGLVESLVGTASFRGYRALSGAVPASSKPLIEPVL